MDDGNTPTSINADVQFHGLDKLPPEERAEAAAVCLVSALVMHMRKDGATLAEALSFAVGTMAEVWDNVNGEVIGNLTDPETPH
jgi:hypothetical protein